MGSTAVTPKSRKRQIEVIHEEECGEEFDVVLNGEPSVPKAVRKRGKRQSVTYREVISLAKVGQDGKVLECVLSRFPIEILAKVASLSSVWCTVAYRILRKNLGPNSPFLRVWMAQPSEMESFNGDLHYHPELLVEIPGDKSRPVISKIDTVITFATRAMEDQFCDDENELQFPYDATILYGISEKVFANTVKHWNPFLVYDNGWEFPENRSIVTSLYIPKSDYFDVVSFSIPLNSDELGLCDKELFHNILNKNYEIEASKDGLLCQRSIKAVLLFQFHKTSFLQSFIECANLLEVNILGGIFNTIGFNSNDEHHSNGVGVSFWGKTDELSCLKISTYRICMTNPGAKEIVLEIKEQCSSYANAFAIMLSCDTVDEPAKNKDIKIVSVEEYLEDDQYWLPNEGHRRNAYIQEGLKIFRHYMPNVPLIGAVLQSSIVLGATSSSDNGLNGPTDLALLVVTYN